MPSDREKEAMNEEDLAEMYREVVLKRNQSFIHDMFYSENKATIRCH